MATIVVKNNTAVDVFISDVGVLIPASGSDTYTNVLLIRAVAVSENLRTLVTAGTLTVNDGVADVPTAEVDVFLLQFVVTGGSNSAIPANTLLMVEDRVIAIADLVALDSTAIVTATINGRVYSGWNLPDGVATRRQIAVPLPPALDPTFSPALRLSFVAPTPSLAAGNVTIQTEIAYRASLSVVGNAAAYDLTQNTVVGIPATGAAQNAIVKDNIPFPVSSVTPISGIALLSIARLGTAPGDTYTGNVVVLAASFGFRRKVGP